MRKKAEAEALKAKKAPADKKDKKEKKEDKTGMQFRFRSDLCRDQLGQRATVKLFCGLSMAQ